MLSKQTLFRHAWIGLRPASPPFIFECPDKEAVFDLPNRQDAKHSHEQT